MNEIAATYPITLSFSSITEFNRCSRKLELEKFRIPTGEQADSIDTMFGRLVGLGVAFALEHDDLWAGVMVASSHWDSFIEGKGGKHYSAMVRAIQALYRHVQHNYLYIRGSAEQAVGLQVGTNVWFRGYIDMLCYRKTDGQLVVLDIKTTGAYVVDEANYRPLEQAAIYAAIQTHDYCNHPTAEYAPIDQPISATYLVFSTHNESITEIEGDTSPRALLEMLWVVADVAEQVARYVNNDFYFPKRGSGCWMYNSRCPHYGVCDMLRHHYPPRTLSPEPDVTYYHWSAVVETLEAFLDGSQSASQSGGERKGDSSGVWEERDGAMVWVESDEEDWQAEGSYVTEADLRYDNLHLPEPQPWEDDAYEVGQYE